MFIRGIVIHFIFLFSIFDIYFKSPIVRNVIPYQPRHEALADRLVLFIVDGLRAESFVNYSTMPYLRSVANNHGRWGISNTRMPTESRPGHVAVIAGFYEDPSAVLKGWKENPVDFDSVFNQSAYTWCWGAYDIVQIFTKGDVDDHIFVSMFDPYDQSFSTDKNTTHLDAWVFDNVKNFFYNAKLDITVNAMLRVPKIVFFLHLLGTDTSGHTHKPKTQNFLTTLRHVDEGIKDIERLVTNFYNDDGRTTFLMTSDHGMTDWGSHGAGLEHETETPYVIWGAGVQPVKSEQMDPETLGMSLNHRFDINQADLAPLMSTILSIPVPVNSVGELSTEVLNITLSDKAKAVYSNSRQLASQYDRKRQDVENSALTALYKPFEAFTKEKYNEAIEFTERMLEGEALDPGEYEKLILLSEEISDLSLIGLEYYQNYYQNPLLVLVTLSFVGWIMCLVKTLLEQKINNQTESSSSINICHYRKRKILKHFSHLSNAFYFILCIIAFGLVFVQSLPFQYYIYFLMPIILWRWALRPFSLWIQLLKQFKSVREIYAVWIQSLCYTLGSFALGMSFSYRWMLSIPLLGMAIWPFLSSSRKHLTKQILLAWPASCILLSIFSFMPVVGKDTFIDLVIGAGIVWLTFLILYSWKVLFPLYHRNEETGKAIVLNFIQILLLAASLQNIYSQSIRFDTGTPVSQIYQGFAWIISVISFILPLAFSKRLICRLVAIYTSILNFYLLLSVSHEGLFMVVLIFNAACWMVIEHKLLNANNMGILEYKFDEYEDSSKNLLTFERSISRQDFRRAFIFTLYIILAFFGTGNIASLNSFEVRWVTCFITSFKPFIITGLILLKTLSPFLCVACTFRAVQHLTKAPTGYLHIIVLIYSNIMGIQLLYNVKNYGSWLDIGTSISQFVIVQVITLFIVLINQIAKILTDISMQMFIGGVFGESLKKYV
ncbi:GPI ethanolamine phosphate transferase 1 [Ostrinia nubilalis]|uniref:GPI ethanolamine phosphate transferase 1 n=1 Tax=Ostrinia nubilalis TaxID=29057 RepID=UPI0030822995